MAGATGNPVPWGTIRAFIGLVILFGGFVSLMGYLALTGYHPSANAVASFPAGTGLNQTFALPAGNYTLSWQTWGPANGESYEWEISFWLQDAQGTRLLSGQRNLSERSPCTHDSETGTSCDNPSEKTLGQFACADGIYTLVVLVHASNMTGARGNFGANVFLSDPASFVSRNWGTIWSGVAVGFAWAPVVAVYLVGHRRGLWGRPKESVDESDERAKAKELEALLEQRQRAGAEVASGVVPRIVEDDPAEAHRGDPPP